MLTLSHLLHYIFYRPRGRKHTRFWKEKIRQVQEMRDRGLRNKKSNKL